MVGGTVYSVLTIGNQQQIIVEDEGQFLEVTIEGNQRILSGDSLWWQGAYCYWTPSDIGKQDIPIKRIGYSRSVPIED